jgi:hypothetical protein
MGYFNLMEMATCWQMKITINEERSRMEQAEMTQKALQTISRVVK